MNEAFAVSFTVALAVGVRFPPASQTAQRVAVAFGATGPVSVGVVVVTVVWFVGGAVVQPAATSIAAASRASTAESDRMRMRIQEVIPY